MMIIGFIKRLYYSIKRCYKLENFCNNCCRFRDLDNYDCEKCLGESFVISFTESSLCIAIYIWKDGHKVSELEVQTPRKSVTEFENPYKRVIFESRDLNIKRKRRTERVEFMFQNDDVSTFNSIPEEVFKKIADEIIGFYKNV